ncbi:MAG: 2-C-methyl-D-erythritol 4-phosphate cytidylyltransferase [Nitrospiraceae bacterium]|nr:MAG: 2-C-methyl-D-erythritol 4-phosphate cytidylyltransferase [Nitrospiraceae bacterium]
MWGKIIAIVPAAGLGRRFDAKIKKTFVAVHGMPLLVHTLKRLAGEEVISEIIPVLGEQDAGNGFQLLKEHRLEKIKRIAPGGKERQDSINNALKLLEGDRTAPDSIILIHDGVRPFIPPGLIASLSGWLKNFDGVIPGIPLKETLKEIASDGSVLSTVNRERFRSIQTPQAFTFKVLKNAYDAAFAEGFYATDDAALVERTGGKVKIVPGSPYNIKVTTPEDLEMMEWILGKSHNM